MYKTTQRLLFHWLKVNLSVLDITSIADDDAENPHIDTKEEKRGQKEAWHERRQAKEFQIVPLRKPKCLSTRN
jgi:hypothetical protein